jgi:hypothetical protein
MLLTRALIWVLAAGVLASDCAIDDRRCLSRRRLARGQTRRPHSSRLAKRGGERAAVMYKGDRQGESRRPKKNISFFGSTTAVWIGAPNGAGSTA